MDRELWLERMTWKEVEAALSEGYDTVVIETGSIEQHGPHLPLATDTILGYAFGERVARRLGKALVAPVIRPGISEHHMAFRGTLSLSPQTFKSVLRDYVYSLARHGFRRIVIIWAHGGNASAIGEVLPVLAAELPQVELFTQPVARDFFKAWIEIGEREGIDLKSLGIHAGEGETSMMMACSPDDVRSEMLARGFLGDLVTGEGEHAKLLSRGLHTITETGVLGDPQLARPDRGKAYLDGLADYIAASLIRIVL